MFTRHLISSLIALTGLATLAQAQTPIEPNASRIELQVFDTTANAWTSSTNVSPNTRVEWRVRVSYTGTNTNVFALGSVLYQPTFSNIDNDNTIGTRDDLGVWRQPSNITGETGILSAAEGESGGPLPSYGRVAFGGSSMNTTSQNALTTFRHGGGTPQNLAPAGSWLRVAGSSVISWPPATVVINVDANALNSINRGVASNQAAAVNPVTGLANSLHITGTQNLVIFRGAILLSDAQDLRTIALSIAPGSLPRSGGINSPDDERSMSWQASQFGTIIRTQVAIADASIVVIPSPGAGLLFIAALGFCRNRRR
ncbi:hypothetical protein LBMAG48_17160 [Phycisphaerae bacterium]|nr:hypothetical protein LBMAG48_17160 [Phycisphaerae bacterium]